MPAHLDPSPDALARIRGGDDAGFAAMLRGWKGYIALQARKFAPSPADRQDVRQECAFALWRACMHYSHSGTNFTHYVRRCNYNSMNRDQRRHRLGDRSRRPTRARVASRQRIGAGAIVEDLARRETAAALVAWFDSRDGLTQFIVRSILLEGRSISAVAHRLGCTDRLVLRLVKLYVHQATHPGTTRPGGMPFAGLKGLDFLWGIGQPPAPARARRMIQFLAAPTAQANRQQPWIAEPRASRSPFPPPTAPGAAPASPWR